MLITCLIFNDSIERWHEMFVRESYNEAEIYRRDVVRRKLDDIFPTWRDLMGSRRNVRSLFFISERKEKGYIATIFGMLFPVLTWTHTASNDVVKLFLPPRPASWLWRAVIKFQRITWESINLFLYICGNVNIIAIDDGKNLLPTHWQRAVSAKLEC